MSRFFFGSSTPTPPPPPPQPVYSPTADPISILRPPSSASTASTTSDDSTHPLSRQHFQTASFSALSYLNTLASHTPTHPISLPVLHRDLTARSTLVEQELLELVNRDYSSFVGLGTSLRGGEGKVEDLRLGLLGFRRKIEGGREEVVGVMKELEEGVGELRGVLKEMEGVRRGIDVERRLSELEMELQEDEGVDLRGVVERWCVLDGLIDRMEVGDDFVKSLASRRVKTRETIVERLGDRLWDIRKRKEQDGGLLLECLDLFDLMDEREEPQKVLREYKEAKAKQAQGRK